MHSSWLTSARVNNWSESVETVEQLRDSFTVTKMSSSIANGSTGAFSEIVIIRHGETVWNTLEIVQGQLDSELTEIGRQQAIQVAQRLSKEHKFDAIYSSDLNRAHKTANIIAGICDLPPVILESALRDRHLGDLQGLTFPDGKKMHPAAYQLFRSTDRDLKIPGGGESRNQISERCVSCIERIASKHQGERVIIVTHCVNLLELYRHACPTTPAGRIKNCSVNVFQISESGGWVIKSWGDSSHLGETTVLERKSATSL